MAPIPPAAILSLIQTGYPVNLVFRLLVQEINGIRNRFGGEARSQSADPDFYPLLEKMSKIQSKGGLGMRATRNDKNHASTLIILRKRDEPTDALSQELRQILKLDLHDNEFNVVYGAISRNDKEIAILTRSFLEILIDLSADIQVPALHVEEKRVSPTHGDEAMIDGKVQPLIRILSSSDRPQEAFASVPYRKFHFWIDDRDLMSKNIFSFLMFVSTLVETGDKGLTPFVTVPTN